MTINPLFADDGRWHPLRPRRDYGSIAFLILTLLVFAIALLATIAHPPREQVADEVVLTGP